MYPSCPEMSWVGMIHEGKVYTLTNPFSNDFPTLQNPGAMRPTKTPRPVTAPPSTLERGSLCRATGIRKEAELRSDGSSCTFAWRRGEGS